MPILGRALLAALVAGQACGFTIELNGTSYPWDQIGQFVMPGETLHCMMSGSGSGTGWAASGGELVQVDSLRADWVAPAEPGLYRLSVTDGKQVVLVNIFVKVPFSHLKNGMLNGYRIGRYPKTNPFPSFDLPDGFVEVTADNLDTPVSPCYTLREFVSRQPDEFPKYLVLREELVLKLELLTDLVKSKGHKCDKLTVFSGFRPPAFHRSRGGGRHSAHVYGGAADILVDCDGNESMDDLNGDGRSTSKDAILLAQYVEELEQQHPELVGGCGWYRRNRVRGPFVHTDVRGERMRWHE